MGRVSNIEKDRIIANSALGIVNPSGLGENCPASVLDFQSAGVPVVTAKRNGLIDTVLDGVTGRLVISQRQLEEAIVELLQDTQLNKKYSDAGPIFVGEKFNFVSICESWKGLIYSIQGRLELPSQDVPSPIGFRENLILLNYKLGNSINRNNLLPSYAKLDSILRRFLRLMLKRNS